MFRPTVSLILVLTLPCLVRAHADAAGPPDPNNGNIPLCTAAGAQFVSAIASDGAGGAIVAWLDVRDSAHNEIYVQRTSAAGVPQWTAKGLALTVGQQCVTPRLVSDGAKGAIVVWSDRRSGNLDIYAQRVSASGVPLWTPNGVPLCTAAEVQDFSEIVSDGSGGAIVTWLDSRHGNGYDIYAQRVSAAGVPQWTADGVPICTALAAHDQTMTSDGAGGAIIAWQDARNGYPNNVGIYAQRVNGAGVQQWASNGVTLCVADERRERPRIASDGAGGAIVAWADFRRYPNNDTYAQRVNAAGVPQWTANGVALCTAPTGHSGDPMIVTDGAGGAIVAWTDFRRDPNDDIYVQRVNAAGVPQWAASGVALCTADGYQSEPTIVSDGSGGAIVAWYDCRSSISSDIYAQRVNAAGVLRWTIDGTPVSTARGEQLGPIIASDGAGGAIVTWQDTRSGPLRHVYAQHIDRFGKPSSRK